MDPRSLVLLCLLTVTAAPVVAFDAGHKPARHRVRTTDARSADLLQRGIERSPILRDLVAAIEAMPVMVYVVLDDDLPTGLDGRTTLLSGNGKHRYLRVSLKRQLPESVFIGVLAHELEHVREIAAEPAVTDADSLTRFYRRIGDERQVRGLLAFETEGARRVGDLVRREVLRKRGELR